MNFNIYYNCYGYKYETVTINKSTRGIYTLTLGNLYPEIKIISKECNTIISLGDPYVYFKLKNGYLLFGGSVLGKSHFGYGFTNKKNSNKHISKRVHKTISTFCEYLPMSEKNFKIVIKELTKK